MQIKFYKYNTIISLENIVSFTNTFIKDTYDEVKYIEIQIKLVHSNSSEIVNLTGNNIFKINTHSKMKQFNSNLKKSIKLLQPHYKNSIFSEIQFHYNEISYSRYITVNSSRHFKNKNGLKSFIKQIKTKK